MESVLRVRLEVPFWCSFRDPTGVNVHTTFRLPPLTALYGLIANALGLAQDDYSLRPRLRFSVSIERPGELVESYSKIMKIREPKSPEELAKPGNIFISTSVIKQKLIRPSFSATVLAELEDLRRIREALINPMRPLYLGESDDVVDLIEPEILPLVPVVTNRFDCVMPGVQSPRSGEPPASIVNLPVHFVRLGRSDWRLQRRLYTYHPDGRPLILDAPVNAFTAGGKHIVFEQPVELD